MTEKAQALVKPRGTIIDVIDFKLDEACAAYPRTTRRLFQKREPNAAIARQP